MNTTNHYYFICDQFVPSCTSYCQNRKKFNFENCSFLFKQTIMLGQLIDYCTP
jgi:hypothetical protein